LNDEHAHLKNIRHLRHVLQKDLIQAADFDKKIAHNQLSLNTIKMSTAEWKEYINMSAANTAQHAFKYALQFSQEEYNSLISD
jgi:hypothetical protein